MERNPDTYSAWSKDSSIRASSSSGGLYHEIARHLLEQEYAVAGAGYKEDFTVEHDLITSVEQIDLLKGTKYVQSDMSFIRKKMRDSGKRICFFGTPCQVASVDADFKVDLVCRGIISRGVYLAYLRDLEKTYNSKIKNVEFKNKDHGWNKGHVKIQFANGKIYQKSNSEDVYMQGFVKENILMQTPCFNCRFRKDRFSDITIGDFWGYKDPLGVSLVIIRTEKGRKFFDSLDLIKKKENYSEAFRHNYCLEESPISHPRRKEFLELIKTRSFTEAYEECIG